MKQTRAWAAAALTAAALALPPARAHAQANATATQALELSAFGGGTGTWTNLSGGRNLGITAGADLAFLTFRRFRPVIEVRGTYPIHSGTIDSQKSVLAGLKVERQYGRLHPYADFLIGRGQIDYQRGGLQVGSFVYLYSTSTVFSPGVGLDYDVTPQWSIKADFQYQSWDVPFATVDGAPAPVSFAAPAASTTGTIHPRVLTLGAVYRFDFNHHYKRSRRERDADFAAPPPPPPMPPAQSAAPSDPNPGAPQDQPVAPSSSSSSPLPAPSDQPVPPPPPADSTGPVSAPASAPAPQVPPQ